MKSLLSRLFFNRWAAFVHDLLCVPLAMLLAYWLRFNLEPPPPQFVGAAWAMLAVAVPVQGLLFWRFGFYRGFWRFASLPDLLRIIQSVGLGSVVCALMVVVFGRVGVVPRSVFLLYPLLLIIFLSGSRIAYRYWKDRHFYLPQQSGRRALLIGAGRAGDSLVRDLLASDQYQPLGFLDDDPRKHGRELRGVRVLGDFAALAGLAPRLGVEVVLLAIPSASRSVIRRMVQQCAALGIRCQTLPALTELTGQDIQARHLRDITVDDLLGREPVPLDDVAIGGYLAGQVVLVTGGGGSIGSELCRQIASLAPRRLVILENSEFNLYSIEMELRKKFPELELAAVLGDVKTVNRVEAVFARFSPQVVFHAAAYKHVPMLESNWAEGVFNNVIGTWVVAEAAHRFGARRFVLVSTDKAVNPTSVMGATKRIAELYCQNLAQRSKTRFITTRFGNVLGSAGSVVPLFARQIKEGGPVTVTHKDITRFFMTIPEAVGLILQAGAMGQGGEIFVLEMGEPVLIRELAEQMIRLSGLRVGEEIKIEYIGLRPGEKLYEEVFHGGEGVAGTSHPKIMLAQARLVDWEWLKQELIALREAAEARDRARLLVHLQTIVPEFTGGGGREEESPPAAPLRLVRQAELGPVQKIGRDGKKILTGARGG